MKGCQCPERVLGKVRLDPIAVALGTGYSIFESPFGIEGLCKVEGPRLNILAIIAKMQGNGCFRRFIEQAKQEFEEIGVWEVWNEWLPAKLLEYGFKEGSEFQSGEIVTGYVWRKSKPISRGSAQSRPPQAPTLGSLPQAAAPQISGAQ